MRDQTRNQTKKSRRGQRWTSGATAFLISLFSASTGILLHGGIFGVNSAIAAEKITFRFAPIEQSISVSELREFADTGKQSSTIKIVLRQTKLNPEDMQIVLSETLDITEYDASLALAERILNSYVMELVLTDVGRLMHPPRSTAATVQALRGSLVTSLADDNKISLIEFLEKYPTELVIEGDVINSIVNRILDDIEDLEAPLAKIIDNWEEENTSN